MRVRSLVAAIIVCVLLPGVRAAAQEEAGREASPVAAAVAAVETDRLAENVRLLTSVRTRFVSSRDHVRIADALVKYFEGLGLEVEDDGFDFIYKARTRAVDDLGPFIEKDPWGNNRERSAGVVTTLEFPARGRNIIATRRGTQSPERVVIVGAHYDSYVYNSPDAPGADDNASGTAAVLEIARVLARTRPACTLVFIAFDAEEAWMEGSTHYARRANARQEQIVAMINLDMIGYDHADGRVRVSTNKPSVWLADRLIEHAKRVSPALRVKPELNEGSVSDHRPFWDQGFSAIMVHEERHGSKNPNYHKATDTADTLNIPFLSLVTKAVVATVADLAGIER